MNNVVNFDNIKIENKILNDKFLRAKDLSEIFVNTTQGTFDNWVKVGLLTRYKICGGVYYSLCEVIKLIENSKQ